MGNLAVLVPDEAATVEDPARSSVSRDHAVLVLDDLSGSRRIYGLIEHPWPIILVDHFQPDVGFGCPGVKRVSEFRKRGTYVYRSVWRVGLYGVEQNRQVLDKTPVLIISWGVVFFVGIVGGLIRHRRRPGDFA